jgi:hypothetical protein
LAISAVGDILHFAQAFFWNSASHSELEADSQNLVHDQNLVCAFPKLQRPSGLPAAAFLRPDIGRQVIWEEEGR